MQYISQQWSVFHNIILIIYIFNWSLWSSMIKVTDVLLVSVLSVRRQRAKCRACAGRRCSCPGWSILTSWPSETHSKVCILCKTGAEDASECGYTGEMHSCLLLGHSVVQAEHFALPEVRLVADSCLNLHIDYLTKLQMHLILDCFEGLSSFQATRPFPVRT